MGGWESTSLAGAGRGRSVEQILKILGQTLLVHLPHMELQRLCMWGYSEFPQIKPTKIKALRGFVWASSPVKTCA